MTAYALTRIRGYVYRDTPGYPVGEVRWRGVVLFDGNAPHHVNWFDSLTEAMTVTEYAVNWVRSIANGRADQ